MPRNRTGHAQPPAARARPASGHSHPGWPAGATQCRALAVPRSSCRVIYEDNGKSHAEAIMLERPLAVSSAPKNVTRPRTLSAVFRARSRQWRSAGVAVPPIARRISRPLNLRRRQPGPAASLARVAGSRTASGCPGRSCRAAWASCSMIPIPSGPAGRWRRCSTWTRSRSPRWSAPPTRPDASMATYVLIHRAGDVGWYWHLVERELRTRGHGVVVMDLPVDHDAATLSDTRTWWSRRSVIGARS
jgi:hypothetical protein